LLNINWEEVLDDTDAYIMWQIFEIILSDGMKLHVFIPESNQ